MTIDEAIESLEKILTEPIYHGIAGDVDAIKLGIEALKRIAKEREFPHVHIGTELPGETPEEEL